MPSPDFVLLYVADPVASAAFYAGLLDRAAVEASPGFALFALDGGTMLGLWARHEVLPPAGEAGSGGELAFTVPAPGTVDSTHEAWQARGLPILQPPVALDFGRSFVAADPDGHRLRVFCPNPA
jgi:predicted enzyme related to lactoylglutathione lyase